jgi:hypothetical protein
MCQFNLLITDNTIKNIDLKKILVENNFGYQEIKNESLLKQFTNDERVILTVKEECDCNSILGKANKCEIPQIDIQRTRRKLRKKKWSENKIERYLFDSIKSQNRTLQKFTKQDELEEKNWITLLEELKSRKVRFGILIHDFTNKIDEEQIKTINNNQFKIEEIHSGQLRRMKQDEIYWIK